MSRFAKLFAANAIAVTGLGAAAIALSATASAEPVAPPVIPNVPALGMIQQFATNPASVGAVLQTAATALNGASELVGGGPATLPVSPIQGAPGVPVMPIAPATMPIAPATMPIAPATTPLAPAAAPAGPASAIAPLLSQLGVPGSLINLAPTGLPLIGNGAAAPVAPVAAPAAAPLAVAPAAPVAPLLPLAALP